MIDYKSQSLANQVYETIERNILNGVYSKGAVISEMKLSEELGVSRTPIREAMTRLETERLIETTSTGTIVVGISDKDVKDMFQVKLHLDPLIMKMAATNISAHALEKLKENLDALMSAIVKAKPASTKGQYIKSCVVATTMGPGIKLNVAKFGA